jgi:hypothetical protein
MEKNLFQQKQIDDIVGKFDKNPKNKDIESITQLEPEKRLSKLIELGILRDLEGYEWGCLGGDRFYVFADVNGVPIPMYKSSTHTGEKRSDLDFFPFFGTQANNQDWLIKGDTHKDTDTFYGRKELEDVSKILTEVFNFNTDRLARVPNKDFKPGIDSPWEKVKDVDNFVSEGREIESSQKLNQLLSERFDIDFNKVNQTHAYSLDVVNYVKEKIFQEIE